VEFRVLGPVEALEDGVQLAVGHAKQRAVLAVLILDLNRVVPTGRLVDRVWGDEPPTSARNLIHGYVGKLKSALGAASADCASVARRADGYVLEAPSELVDLLRFRRLVTDATVASSDADSERLLRTALALWRGDAVSGLSSPWLAGMRETLAQERLAALLNLNDIELRLGQHTELAAKLAALAVEHPADERLVAQLMLALYRSGRQAKALRHFEHTRRQLATELGAHPGPDLQKLHQQILRNDPELAVHQPAQTTASPRRPPSGRPKSGNAEAPGFSSMPLIPRQLPSSVAHFVGRAAELRALTSLLTTSSESDSLAMAVISGAPGIGKTALAVRWSHSVADGFPDGQLYVNLHGFDPSVPPTDAADAIRGVLDSLGVPSHRIPAALSQQASLYRSTMADKRMLVVLDNARDAHQVRPLLPGSATCAVVITTRERMIGLAASEGASQLQLALFDDCAAHELLERRLGVGRLRHDRSASHDLLKLCGGLPLALAIVAARAAAAPGIPLAELADELRSAPNTLAALDTSEPASSLQAALSASYNSLDLLTAQMFRMLGLLSVDSISVPVAASLAASSLEQAGSVLTRLANAQLLIEGADHRYSMHDLVREYAAGEAQACDAQDGRREAVGRVVDYYLQTAAVAVKLLYPAWKGADLAPSRFGARVEALRDRDAAMAWFEGERAALASVATLAAAWGFDDYAWQIPFSCTTFLEITGHWRDSVALWEPGLAAAERVSSTMGQAFGHRSVAAACIQFGEFQKAHEHMGRALGLWKASGHRGREANIHLGMAQAFERQERYDEELRHAREALSIYRALDDSFGQANALNAVGWSYARLGDYRMSISYTRQSLHLHQDLKDVLGTAHALDSLGLAHHCLSEYDQAVECYQQALKSFASRGDRYNEAGTLVRIGDSYAEAGDPAQARRSWLQALEIVDGEQPHKADEIRRKLAQA
jgi:DNA-binding SARP family transcriptional activator/tetratricopeptide (TPR) repeat protein